MHAPIKPTCLRSMNACLWTLQFRWKMPNLSAESLSLKVTDCMNVSMDFLKMSNKSQCHPIIFFRLPLTFLMTKIQKGISWKQTLRPALYVWYLDNRLKVDWHYRRWISLMFVKMSALLRDATIPHLLFLFPSEVWYRIVSQLESDPSVFDNNFEIIKSKWNQKLLMLIVCSIFFFGSC